jgi:ribosomal protein S18 acetylase RimI-like enzyme
LSAASLRLEEESRRLDLPFALVPLVRLAWFGLDVGYQHRGLAPDLFDLALDRAEEAREIIGARLMLADANPEVVGFYEREGFESASGRSPEGTVRMWLDLDDLPS